MGKDAEAPPSYESVFGQLKAQKSQSTGVVDYAKKSVGLCCGKVAGVAAIVIGVILCVALGLALPIAEIVIGAQNLKNCPAQDYLAIYLIVMGVFSIVSGCTGGGSKATNRDEEESQSAKQKVGSCCNSLIGLFLTAWFVCGNVWIFQMQECDSNMEPSGCFTKDIALSNNATNYCDPLLYGFVFWETIAKWILLGVFLVGGLLCCCVMCCAYCCSGNSD